MQVFANSITQVSFFKPCFMVFLTARLWSECEPSCFDRDFNIHKIKILVDLIVKISGNLHLCIKKSKS